MIATAKTAVEVLLNPVWEEGPDTPTSATSFLAIQAEKKAQEGASAISAGGSAPSPQPLPRPSSYIVQSPPPLSNFNPRGSLLLQFSGQQWETELCQEARRKAWFLAQMILAEDAHSCSHKQVQSAHTSPPM